MRFLVPKMFIRPIVISLLVASAAIYAAGCGGDDSRFGGEKSGAFQPRSGISWGN